MDILLINPPLSAGEETNLKVNSQLQEPLGLAYLATSIRQKRPQDKVVILDCQALSYSLADLENYFLKNKFTVVGITTPTLAFYNTQKTAELIKKKLDTVIIIGGPHPTILPDDTLRSIPEIDCAVIGEGEEAIIEILSAIEDHRDFKQIKGIAYRQNGDISINDSRPFIQDIDLIPLPARDLLPMDKYRPSPTFFQRQPAYAIMDARGCPYNCAFCATLYGRSIRCHSKERVCQEIELLISNYYARGIIFRSDTFTANIERVSELCEEIIKRGLNKKISWHCQSRINTVNQDLLKLMKKAGCEGIHYGVETANQRLLELINKRINLDDVVKVFKWTRRTGIRISAYFMIGIPTETKEETLRTIKFAKKCGADYASFSIFTPYPGSLLFDQIKAAGKLRTMDWRNYSSVLSFSQKVTPYVPENRTELELKKMHRQAILEFYLRPKFIIQQLFYVRTFSRLKFLVRGFFALFYMALKQIYLIVRKNQIN